MEHDKDSIIFQLQKKLAVAQRKNKQLEGIIKAIHEDSASATSCRWTYNHNTEAWETDCQETYSFLEGTPTENKTTFCNFCGRRVVEHIPNEEVG